MLDKTLTLLKPGPIKQKSFVPKNKLPRLDDYSVDQPESYWEKWTKVNFSDLNHKSWLNPMEFMETANEAGYKDMNHVCFIRSDLKNGAKIGCEQEGRLPTFWWNNPTVSDRGFEISDEIQTWINMGICVGPLSEEELPFKDYTVNPPMDK